MKITNDKIHYACAIAQKVYSGEMELAEASKIVANTQEMNPGSARMYVEAFVSMTTGQLYTRTISAYATEYYLGQVYSLYGNDILGNAIESVRKHLDYYYKKSNNAPQKKIRSCLEKYITLLEQNIDFSQLERNFQRLVSLSLSESSHDRNKRISVAAKIPPTTQVTVNIYRRNPDVVAEALFRANGICNNCRRPAPFNRATDGSPYLEVHHKILLSQGGEDTIENAVALCPNCHRNLHFGASDT